MKFYLFIYFTYLSNLSWSEAANHTLKQVHVFFRHGSRTPELKDTYPTDTYKEDTFAPMGWGQLTNAGKNDAFKLGQLLHKKYNLFLGDIYTPEVVQVQSTDFDRTKMTALLVLAGLFPPSISQTWNDFLPWMPIPYSYDRDKYDYTLRRPTHYCPSYVKELENVFDSVEVHREIKANWETFKYIEKHTGKPMNTLKDVFTIYQTLNAEEMMNLTLPEWTKSVYPEQIHAIAGKQCYYENYNDILKRLNGGRMLAKVIKSMLEKSSNHLYPSGRKIYLYSGHENNVINILATLNLFEPPHVPKYCSATIIELHYIPDTNKYAVQVYYLRNVDKDPELQKLEGCDVLCPLNNFIQIAEPHVPLNYTKECGSHVNLD